MDKNQKFMSFLENLSNEENDTLIESVKAGFNACFEAEFKLSGTELIKDPFVRGYVEALFFTAPDEDEFAGLGVIDIDGSAMDKIKQDCNVFITSASELLNKAVQDEDYDLEQAGRDFVFTRNGHGVGFWDRGLEEVGDQLSDIARKFGESNLYIGDDGNIYIV